MLFSEIYQKLWLYISWFTYSQNGSLWLQWGLSYFFIFMREALKKSENIKNVHSPQYVPHSTVRCSTRVHFRTNALQHFYEWPILFHERRTAQTFCIPQHNFDLLKECQWLKLLNFTKSLNRPETGFTQTK